MNLAMSTSRSTKRKVAKALPRDGYPGTTKLVLRNAWRVVRSRFPDSKRNPSNAFDLEWGVDTCRIVEQGELEMYSTHQIYAERYEPRFRACQSVTSIWGDATHLPMPAGPSTLYFYYRFEQPVMDKVFANIRGSLMRQPKDIQVIPYDQAFASTLEKDALFVPVRRGKGSINLRIAQAKNRLHEVHRAGRSIDRINTDLKW